jgi:UDPglucose 6-dehydrogenase
MRETHNFMGVPMSPPMSPPDFKAVKSLLKRPVIVDGRNIYDPKEMKKLGFTYIGIGRR